MSYIGRPVQYTNPSIQFFNGTGAQTIFTLNYSVSSENAIMVFISGVQQRVGYDYNVNGSTLTFVSAPIVGTNNITVHFVANNNATITTVADGAITALKLASNAVTTAKILDGEVTVAKLSVGKPSWDASSNLTIGGTCTITGDCAVNGGDLTTTSATFNIAQSNATTITLGTSSATTLTIGSVGSTVTTFQGTGALKLPVGNTSQQPAGSAGMLRYNSQTAAVEYYSTAWTSFSNSAAIADESTSSNTYYPLFASSSTGTLATANVDSLNLTYIPGTGTFYATEIQTSSDISLKNNIAEIDNALNIITKLTGKSFDWNHTGKKSYGVIAQEVEQVIDIVSDIDGKKSVNYMAIIPFLIEAIKELNEKINGINK